MPRSINCCHAYISAQTRREQSNKAISTIAALTLCPYLFGGGFGYAFQTYVVEAFKISAASMKPTLIPGDKLLVRKNRRYVPKHGDMVVFKSPDDPGIPWVKRVAALPDETVQISDGTLLINGRKVQHRRIESVEYPGNGFGLDEPYKVPTNHIFVIGDNTANSEDSRSFGAVSVSDVIGRAYKIYWPPSRRGRLE